MTDIKKLHIRRYGKFEDATFDFTPGLNVVYGTNEAGKSTLQKFSYQMMTGFPTRRKPSEITYYPDDADPAGILVLSNGGRECTVERVGHKNVSVDGGDLAGMMHGADAELMNSVFIISHKDIQEFGALGNDAQKDRVFSAGVVGAGTSARQVMTDLAARAEKLGGASKKKSRILMLVKSLSKLETDLDEARARMRQYPQLAEELGEIKEEHRRLKEARQKLSAELARYRTLVDLQPVFNERAALVEQLEGIDVREVREGHVQAVVSLQKELAESEDEQVNLERDLAVACQRRDAIELDEALWKQRTEIELSEREVTGIGQRRERLDGIRNEIAAAEEELRAASERLGDMSVEHALALSLDDVLKGELSQLETTLPALKRTVETARQQYDQALRARDAAQKILDDLPGGSGPTGDEHIEDDIDALQALRQRRERLQDQVREQAPRTPKWLVSGAWFAVVLFAVMGSVSVVMKATFTGIAFAVVALVALFAAILLRSRRQHEVESEKARREKCRSELQKTDDEGAVLAAELETTWPLTSEKLVGLRRRAREALRQSLTNAAKVSERSKAETRLQEAEITLSSRDAELEAATESLESAETRWTAWLAKYDLPWVTPPIARSLLHAAAAAQAADRKRVRKQDEADRLSAELSAWADGVATLAENTGLRGAHGSPEQCVELLRMRLSEERTRREAYQGCVAKAAETEKSLETCRVSLEATRSELHELLETFGAEDVLELRTFAERYTEVRELRQRVQERDLVLAERLGAGAEANELRPPLEEGSVEQWQRRVDVLAEESERVDDELEKVVEDRTTLQHAINELERSAQIPELQLQFEGRRAELADAVRQWQTLEAAHRLIGIALKKYREERQPDVLRDAQRYYERATGGRYDKIMLDDESDEVVVRETATGICKDLSRLSSGTEEPLYLAMRMGLAAEFGRNRGPLPVLMDDVLVNLGKKRRREMISAIADFAVEQQVVFFTCHDHILAEFQELAKPNVVSFEDGPFEDIEDAA